MLSNRNLFFRITKTKDTNNIIISSKKRKLIINNESWRPEITNSPKGASRNGIKTNFKIHGLESIIILRKRPETYIQVKTDQMQWNCHIDIQTERLPDSDKLVGAMFSPVSPQINRIRKVISFSCKFL